MHHPVNISLLEKSINTVIARHEALRTVFNHKTTKRPIQIVLKRRHAKVYYEDITSMDQALKQSHIQRYKHMQKERGFDLSRDLLINLAVFRTDSEIHHLIFSFHHIIMDGWCLGIILKELFQVYKSLEGSKPVVLEGTYPYSSYIYWLLRKNKKEAQDYWKRYLNGFEQLTSIPKREGFSEKKEYVLNEFIFKLDEEMTKGIADVAKRNNVTFSTVFQALWATVLRRYNRTNDVVFGVVVSGRPHEIEGVDRIVGLFINTIPTRVRFGQDKKFSQVIKELQSASLESEKYSTISLAEIQANSQLKQTLLDHIIVFENYPLEEVDDSGEGTGLCGYVIDNVDIFEQTIYDFNIIVIPGNETSVKLSYNTQVYDNELIRRIEGHLKQAINAVIKNCETVAEDIEILTENEKQQILFNFNHTKTEYPKDKTLHKLFEVQAEKTPDNTALIFGNKHLTYREFNEKSNQLARVLRQKGVKPDSIVGIMADRSIDMMVGIMGTLKAGGAYLPIDPAYPKDRIQFMLQDSKANILLTQSSIASALIPASGFQPLPSREAASQTGTFTPGFATRPLQPSRESGPLFLGRNAASVYTAEQKPEMAREAQQCFHIINLDDDRLYQGDGSNVENMNRSSDLAYVIYTSGSTGQPKGVLIEHKSVVNIISHLQKKYPVGENDTYLFKTTYTFDVSVAEIFGWFYENGRLAILESGEERYPDSIVKAVETYGVTHINFVPSMLSVFLESIDERDAEILRRLRYVFTAGEAVSGETVRKFYSQIKGVRLENIYGPTESTIYATGYSLDGSEQSSSMPIGKPLQNIKVYIMDNRRLQPVGIPGELCICGDGLARGYLNRSALTSEKFVPNPFAASLNADTSKRMDCNGEMCSHAVLYRTGDLARWLPDGNIEFMGRMDDQVKIRGFRIELGEIESHLLKLPTIKQALVMAREGKHQDKYLCAYIAAERSITVQQIKEMLSETLPGYMIPSSFVFLDSIPLTPNGKVDRRALPEPGEEAYSGKKYAQPTNRTEEIMVEVWKEVLGLQQVGIKDSFLDLGGDSIKAIQVAARLKKHQFKIEIRDLFHYRTIEKLAQAVSEIGIPEIEQGTVYGEVPLAPAQKWFFENRFSNMNHWNQAVILYGEKGFDVAVIEKVFEKITEHHDALRMVYRFEAGKIVQYNRALGEGEVFKLNVFDLTNNPNPIHTIETETNNQHRGIDLKDGPLIRLALFKTMQGDYLLIVIHHLVIDGVSWRILFEDFATGYSQVQNGQDVMFEKKTHSYKDWASKIEEYALGKEIQLQRDYWKRIAESDVPALPTDNTETGECKVKDGCIVEVRLTQEETSKLLKETNKAYNTEIDDILLTALGMAVKEWTKQGIVLIHLEGHGREDIITNMDITRTVGWFTSLYPVLLDMSRSDDISYLVRHIKEDLRSIPDKGIGYGILRYISPESGLNADHTQTPEICFNYLGQLGYAAGTDLFSISSLQAGDMVSPESKSMYKLNINAVIQDGMLKVAFQYNMRQYCKQTISSFAHSYRRCLVSIIDHCISQYAEKKKTTLTPSDVGDKNISIEDLEYMSEFIDAV
jgi:amino acid adenylation domain-containing protein/non-ribosomal peptide synthase protein (TIGR01720 family)